MAKERFVPEDYWITREEIESSPRQMYRAYIFNYQEDMMVAYRTRSYQTAKFRSAVKQLNEALKKNYKQFHNHLDDPSGYNTGIHLNVIRNSLQDVLDAFGQQTDNIFYKAVMEVYEEYA